MNSVAIGSETSDSKSHQTDALTLRGNQRLNELLKEPSSDTGDLRNSQSVLESLLAKQRDIDAKHATLFNLVSDA